MVADSGAPAPEEKPQRAPLVLPADRTKAGNADLARGIVDDAQRLVELQLELAKAELKALAVRNAIAIALMAVAGMLLVIAIFVAVPLIIIELIPNHRLAAVVYAIVYVVAAVILALAGYKTLKLEAPQRTIAALKETKEWLVRQISTSR